MAESLPVGKSLRGVEVAESADGSSSMIRIQCEDRENRNCDIDHAVYAGHSQTGCAGSAVGAEYDEF